VDFVGWSVCLRSKASECRESRGESLDISYSRLWKRGIARLKPRRRTSFALREEEVLWFYPFALTKIVENLFLLKRPPELTKISQNLKDFFEGYMFFLKTLTRTLPGYQRWGMEVSPRVSCTNVVTRLCHMRPGAQSSGLDRI